MYKLVHEAEDGKFPKRTFPGSCEEREDRSKARASLARIGFGLRQPGNLRHPDREKEGEG